LNDESKVVELAKELRIRFVSGRVEVDGEDLSDAIRGEQAGAGASRVAALPALRAALLHRQHNFAVMPGLVADGRDMGTVVFPHAELKIYLTASAEERARRRYNQLINKGGDVSLPALLEDIRARDERDVSRSVAPLRPADDAVAIDSTAMTIEEVVKTVLDLAAQRGMVV
jgi:cytidylate kinase